jgi:ankyrin repeat protein
MDYEEFLLCCRFGEYENVQEYLKISSEIVMKNSGKSLFMAAGNGHVQVLKLLLAYTTPKLLNTPNEEGSRPLHWAALNGHIEACKLLISHGAVAVLRNNAGFSPATLAEQREHLKCANVLLQSYDPEDGQEEDGAEAVTADDEKDMIYSCNDPDYEKFSR